jgi:hypothetical protein
VYLNDIANEIRDEVPGSALPEGPTLPLFRLYGVLLLAKGADVSPRDVHNAWVAWMASRDPDHESLVPFDALDSATQEEDSPYVVAIKKVARRRAAEAP